LIFRFIKVFSLYFVKSKELDMLPKYFKVLLIFILANITFFAFVDCGSGNKTIKGVIVEGSVLYGIGSKTSGFNIKSEQDQRVKEKKLQSILWQSFEYKMINNRFLGASGGAQREQFCVVSGSSAGIAVGTEVDVVEEATCMWVLHQIDSQNSDRYQVSLTKVRSVETGETGWTWSKSVKISE